jgi:hypothetical protein
VLNTDVFAALYRAAAPEAGRPFAQVKVSKLKVVPVPAPDSVEHLSALAKALCGTCDAVRRKELVATVERRVAAAYGVEPGEMERVKNAVGGSRGEAAVQPRPGGREGTS